MGSPVLNDIASSAIQQFGVDPSLIDDALSASNIPRTRTRTSHGLTLRVGAGRVIGAVQVFGHDVSRDVTDVWELDGHATGYQPVDIVPGNVVTRTLRIERLDLFTQVMEQILGTPEVVVLADQSRPFVLRSAWQSPVGVLLAGRATYQYDGCWFTSLGRTVSSTDSRLVTVSAEIRYQLRRRVA